MGLSNSTFTYKHIHFRAPPTNRAPLPTSGLPEGVSRFYIPTAQGDLEILYAKPSAAPKDPNASPKSPIFFAHGGMGCAAYWLEYMTYLSSRGIPCYAVSYRGHGNSWYPSFLRMVYGTTKRMLADDLLSGIRFVQEREDGREVVLVGHSSGGGLSQFVLSEGNVKVNGLVLAGAVPGFGSLGVYINWFKLDPWFTLRMVFHGWHPNSPLSHPKLVRRVFFSDEQTDEYIENFHKLGSPYESFLWPLGMGYKFVDPARVLGQISGWGTKGPDNDRVLVLAGDGDKIMTYPVMEKLAWFYRRAWAGLVRDKKLDAAASSSDGGDDVRSLAADGGLDSAGQGVRLAVVPGAGHHLQNDVQWEIGAKKLLEFYEQL
ncbi:putative Abhydrolase domain containing protein [Rhypophila sp. PSN 637]